MNVLYYLEDVIIECAILALFVFGYTINGTLLFECYVLAKYLQLGKTRGGNNE